MWLFCSIYARKSAVSHWFRLLPSISIVPLFACNRPASNFSKVDLPEPLAPVIMYLLPFLKVRLISQLSQSKNQPKTLKYQRNLTIKYSS